MTQNGVRSSKLWASRLKIASTRWPNSQTFVWWAIVWGQKLDSHHKNVGKISPASGTGFF